MNIVEMSAQENKKRFLHNEWLFNQHFFFSPSSVLFLFFFFISFQGEAHEG